MNDITPFYHSLEEQLGHHFSDPALFEEALRHSSYVNEQSASHLRDNERFEFLGDAVLNLIIGDLLMRSYPDLHEGDLSRIRANLVNETQLAAIARSLNLGDYLQLGKGEIQTNGRDKNSILANAMEAIIAAVYLDIGYDQAYPIVQRLFNDLIDDAPKLSNGQDFKSRLQEAVQEKIKEVPIYQIVGESGPDHAKTFYVTMTVGDITTHGAGRSKKTAEQDAARKGLEAIEADGENDSPSSPLNSQ